MNRERLTILRDHLASLPDDRVRMDCLTQRDECGTVACIAGWARELFFPENDWTEAVFDAQDELALTDRQRRRLFVPAGYERQGRYTRSDAIAAIQSMLDSPDDDALPVWPERAEPSQ